MKIRFIAGAAAVAVALTASLTACGGTGADTSAAGAKTVTVYSADGLAGWYRPQFAAFTRQTGITVNYVEAGSSEAVSRVEKERSNPQADVLVTLPPFIQQADKDGMLAPLGIDTTAVAAADKATDGTWTALVNNYSCFISSSTQTPAATTWDALLSPAYQGKLQYSTPGQAGDGTAVLVLLQHEMGKQGALDYLKKLQANNVGPASSTGKLQPKVSSGSLLVANGDVQMNLSSIQNDKSAFSIVFPTVGATAPETVSLPYAMGLTSNAPHADAARELMTYLLSAQAQREIAAQAMGSPARTDVHPTDANFAKVQQAMKGVTVYHPDWNTVLSGLDADVAAYNTATGA
jgi:2-aminoethylphosphonate transport system substrate-binding protein